MSKRNIPKDGDGLLAGMAALLAGMLPSFTGEPKVSSRKPSRTYPPGEDIGSKPALRRLHQPVREKVFTPPTGRLLVKARNRKRGKILIQG